jgi:hypothetical protein
MLGDIHFHVWQGFQICTSQNLFPGAGLDGQLLALEDMALVASRKKNAA